MSRVEADVFLRSLGAEVRTTAGGYTRYTFSDSSEVWLRPNGEVVRLPQRAYDSQGQRINKGMRLDENGVLTALHTTRGTRGRLTMDYQALALGAAASVVTAVTVDKDQHTIMISCLYDPQDVQMPYTLYFKQCELLAWQTFKALPDLQQLDAELIGISLGPSGAQQLAVLTTDVFELSFVYGSFSLQTPTSASYSIRT